MDYAQTLILSGVAGTILGNKSIGTFADVNALSPIQTSQSSLSALSALSTSSQLSTPIIIVIVVIVLIVEVIMLISTYRLTGSGLQTVLFFVFGLIYLIFAYMYYGMSGYKFIKSNTK